MTNQTADTMCYFSTTIASHFIERSNSDGAPLTTLQVTKLTYIAHGWCLALWDAPLISDSVQAWEFGPVMPALNALFKDRELKKDNVVLRPMSSEETSCIKPKHRELLNKVYAKFRNLSPEELINLLHEKDTPWFAVWQDGKGDKEPISNEATKQYYSNRINQKIFDALSEFPPITTKAEAIRVLKDAGIIMPDGELNPVYFS